MESVVDKMLPCMPAFALKRHAEVTVGREVFEEHYGKHTMYFAHHNVANVEVTRWYEDEPGQTLEFGRPRENIALKHPDDPTVWCVVRAGHEITVIYDAKTNAVTFLNMKGIFSLRDASPALARWAAAAERVLPFTGNVLLRHISSAFYLPSTCLHGGADQKPLAIDRDDSEHELVITGGPGGGGGDMHDRPDSRGAAGPAQSKGSLPGSSCPPSHFDIFERGRREPRTFSSPSVNSSGAVKTPLKFSIEKANVGHEGGGSIKELIPTFDGASDEELLELHVYATKVLIVKVLLMQRCVCLSLCR